MRVLISGGGTGGHVYPALVVADALHAGYPDVEILYVGSPKGMEKDLLARTQWPYRAVDAGQVRGMSPWVMLRSSRQLWHGYRQAGQLLREWSADVVFVTGGYVTVPVALAARRQGIPVLVYLPDLEPGWAIRLLGRFANRVAVSFDEVQHFFARDKVWVSGYPVRSELYDLDRQASIAQLGLDPNLSTLLVFGGSRGARSINQAVAVALPGLLADMQVVHVSGQLDWPWVEERRAALAPDLQARYHIFPYLHQELPAAFAAADLVVSRAGAATLAEWPAVGLPSILVPYPYSGQHQQQNADFMVSHGAAICLKDADLDELEVTVKRLQIDNAALEAMGGRARTLACPDAARKLAAELVRLGASRGG